MYLSEGIADLTAGIITAIVIFTGFPRIFKQREAPVKTGRGLTKKKTLGKLGASNT